MQNVSSDKNKTWQSETDGYLAFFYPMIYATTYNFSLICVVALFNDLMAKNNLA